MIVEYLKEKDATVIHLNLMRLDAENAEVVFEMLESVINKTQTVILNLSCMKYMDSSGLGVILNCYRETKAHGRELRVVNESMMVKTLFDLVYLEKILLVCTSVTDALSIRTDNPDIRSA